LGIGHITAFGAYIQLEKEASEPITGAAPRVANVASNPIGTRFIEITATPGSSSEAPKGRRTRDDIGH